MSRSHARPSPSSGVGPQMWSSSLLERWLYLAFVVAIIGFAFSTSSLTSKRSGDIATVKGCADAQAALNSVATHTTMTVELHDGKPADLRTTETKVSLLAPAGESLRPICSSSP